MLEKLPSESPTQRRKDNRSPCPAHSARGAVRNDEGAATASA